MIDGSYCDSASTPSRIGCVSSQIPRRSSFASSNLARAAKFKLLSCNQLPTSATLPCMRFEQTLFLSLALASSLFAQDPQPVADRLAAQNVLFEEQYESDLRNFPERATAFGDYRYNDKLADYSLLAIAQRNETNAVFLSRLQAIATAGFSDQDQRSE